ncbi:MAG TPA: hypothetical protein VFO76_03625, partial [Candidatus Kapabacteria bacterium]|nr:hypothetical protein [Candidatus Kapabacteria bacterium]
MKKYLSRAVCLVCAVIFCVLFNGLANGQEAAIPRIISYQGQLKAENNLPVSGNHRVSVAFYSNTEGTELIWK